MADEESPKIIDFMKNHPKIKGDSEKNQQVPELPIVLVVEDDIFIREHWSKVLKSDSKPFLVRDYKTLKKNLEKDPGLSNKIKMVVTDMNLEDEEGNGIDVAKLIRSINTEIPILLSSDGTYKKADYDGFIDGVIPKEPKSFSDLIRILSH